MIYPGVRCSISTIFFMKIANREAHVFFEKRARRIHREAPVNNDLAQFLHDLCSSPPVLLRLPDGTGRSTKGAWRFSLAISDKKYVCVLFR